MRGLASGEGDAPAKPILAVAPTRERTVLGVGPAQVRPPAREPSGQEPPPEGWDLPEPSGAPVVHEVAKPAPHAAPAPAPPAAPAPEPSLALDLVVAKRAAKPFSEASLAAAGVPRPRGRGWLAALVVIALLAGGAYAERHRIPWARMRSAIGAVFAR
jgi:hypothetical protein